MAITPFFLSASGSECFCLYHPPACLAGAGRGAVVYVHPFAEEMNFSRHMAARQARTMAAQGYAVLQIDLLGCGDSAGNFSDATWDIWLDDVVAAARWLQARHPLAPLTFWGLRVGCLLAAQAAARLDAGVGSPVSFLFWQPVISGEVFWRQFQRLRVAAQMLEEHQDANDSLAYADQNSTEKNQDKTGDPFVEIAGYRISPALIAGLADARLALPSNTQQVCCVELAASSVVQGDQTPSPLSKPLATMVNGWRSHGLDVRCAVLPGAAFWQMAEAEDCPGLRTATLQLLAGQPDGAL